MVVRHETTNPLLLSASPPNPKLMTLPGEDGAREARTLLLCCYSMTGSKPKVQTGLLLGAKMGFEFDRRGS